MDFSSTEQIKTLFDMIFTEINYNIVLPTTIFYFITGIIIFRLISALNKYNLNLNLFTKIVLCIISNFVISAIPMYFEFSMRNLAEIYTMRDKPLKNVPLHGNNLVYMIPQHHSESENNSSGLIQKYPQKSKYICDNICQILLLNKKFDSVIVAKSPDRLNEEFNLNGSVRYSIETKQACSELQPNNYRPFSELQQTRDSFRNIVRDRIEAGECFVSSSGNNNLAEKWVVFTKFDNLVLKYRVYIYDIEVPFNNFQRYYVSSLVNGNWIIHGQITSLQFETIQYPFVIRFHPFNEWRSLSWKQWIPHKKITINEFKNDAVLLQIFGDGLNFPAPVQSENDEIYDKSISLLADKNIDVTDSRFAVVSEAISRLRAHSKVSPKQLQFVLTLAADSRSLNIPLWAYLIDQRLAPLEQKNFLQAHLKAINSTKCCAPLDAYNRTMIPASLLKFNPQAINGMRDELLNIIEKYPEITTDYIKLLPETGQDVHTILMNFYMKTKKLKINENYSEITLTHLFQENNALIALHKMNRIDTPIVENIGHDLSRISIETSAFKNNGEANIIKEFDRNIRIKGHILIQSGKIDLLRHIYKDDSLIEQKINQALGETLSK